VFDEFVRASRVSESCEWVHVLSRSSVATLRLITPKAVAPTDRPRSATVACSSGATFSSLLGYWIRTVRRGAVSMAYASARLSSLSGCVRFIE
jgi:hypothetical protein